MNTASIVSLLSWAVPACFGLHVIEELVWPGTFREWYHRYRPQVAGEPMSYYYKANAVYFTLALLVPLILRLDGLLIWSALLLYNLIFTHIVGAWKTRTYSPGIVTGVGLYIPLFTVTYGYLLSQHIVGAWHVLACLVIGGLPEIYFSLKKFTAARGNALV
jgi:uncharacterized protein with HXXEE motif